MGLFLIPAISFADDWIYFDCSLTCVKDTTYKGIEPNPLDGCQEPFKKGVRSTYNWNFKYTPESKKAEAYDKVYECSYGELDDTTMHCISLEGTKYNAPIKTPVGYNYPYRLENTIEIRRTTLKVKLSTQYQSEKESRIIESEGTGMCEINKLKF